MQALVVMSGRRSIHSDDSVLAWLLWLVIIWSAANAIYCCASAAETSTDVNIINELPEQTTGREVSENESDDEMLSSVLKKARGSLSKSKDQNLTAISLQGTTAEHLDSSLERYVRLFHVQEKRILGKGGDVNKQSTGLAEIDDVDAFNHASPNGTAQAEVPRTGGGNLIEKFRMMVLEDEDDD
ncbi:hypothetical protein M0R45_038167 [Rubus argutus]|uniref:Uncharacterized protein n=1 Tax=Rubus argutus TaxID=59490 RepID=A0AAW1W2I0_RUBAR